mmetsp:Transcript_9420/g.30741  ORF Transcript_9420/g.30741 Transcript_9420/m.30741 type:complete len:410 (+) Transcript_9420:404-1633(+)
MEEETPSPPTPPSEPQVEAMDTTSGEEEEMVAPSVDDELLEKVVAMGFSELRARKALLSGARNAEAALEWCLDHEGDADIDAPIPLVPKSEALLSAATHSGGASAKSIRCVETGRLFRSVEEAQAYATKTGRTNFEESTEEKKPLTDEEKKQKVLELKELAARRRAEREGVEKVEDVDREKKRREQGKEAHLTREQLEKSQRQRELDRVKREKLDEKRERERLRAEIAKDKAERRARGGKLAGKLSADGYAPSIDQNDERRNQGVVLAGGKDDDDDQEGKATTTTTKKAAPPAATATTPTERVDKAIASLSKYKTGGDGGVALKTLAAYVRNAADKGNDDPKYLSIPIDSRAFKERVLPLIGGTALLRAVGFEKTDDAFKLDQSTRDTNLTLLKDTLAKLTLAHANYSK